LSGYYALCGAPRDYLAAALRVSRGAVLPYSVGLYWDFSALAVVCFRLAIEWCRLKMLGPGLTPAGMRVLLAPSIAGLIIAVLVLHIFPAVRGSGVNQTKAALYIYNGYIPFRT